MARAEHRLFYGWHLVGYLLATQMLTIGFLFYGFGVIMDPLAASLGISRGETAYGLSLFTLGIAVYSPLMGWWVDKKGPRQPLLVGVVVLAAGLLVLGRTRSPLSYYALMGMWLSFGVAASGGVPSQSLLVNWFRRKRGMALSMTSAGISLGGLVFAPLTGWLIPRVGWDKAILLPAALLVLAAPLGARMLRNHPEDMGLFRDGDAVDTPDPDAQKLPFRQILADPNFRIVAITYAIALSCMTALMVNLVSYWRDLGMSTEMATLTFALLAGVGMIGKPFFGWIADTIGARAGAMASFLCLGAGTLILLWPSVWNAVPFVIVFGLGIGGAVPMQSAINGVLYGRRHFARVAGILTPWVVSVQAVFYGLTGYAHDRLHSYLPIFAAFAVFIALALLLLTRLELPRESLPPGPLAGEPSGVS